MKKFLVGLTAFAMVFCTNPASAELLKNLRLSGQIDIQATSTRNAADFATKANPNAAGFPLTAPAATPNNDRIGDAQTRVMVHLDWDMLDDVHSHVTFGKNNRNWGNGGGAPGGAADAHGNAQAEAVDGGGLLAQLFIDEAYFKIDKVAGQVDTTFGRQFYGDSGDIVVYYGPSDKAWYGMPINAIDAMRADWATEWIAVTGLVGKITGSSVGTVPQPDVDLRGLNFLFKGNDNIHASFYGWNKLSHNTGALGLAPADFGGAAVGSAGGKNDNLFLIGTKMKLSGGGFWLKGEYDQNFGDNRVAVPKTIGGAVADVNFAPASHYEGWATMGNTGWKGESDSLGMLSLWGEGAIGSGRSNTRENVNDGFTTISGDYRPGSIYGRFAANPAFAGLGNLLYAGINTTDATRANSFVANSTLSNRVIWGGGVKMSPAVANKLTLAVSWWDFRLHRFANAPGQVRPYNGNKHIGAELDVDVIWTHSENVAFATGWGTFQPGGLIQQAAQNDTATSTSAPASQKSQQPVNPVTLAYFDVRVKF
jgi:hypothetical protein